MLQLKEIDFASSFSLAVNRTSTSHILFRQYALLLSYFQYCQHVLDPDVPAKVLGCLVDEQDGDDMDLQKVSTFLHSR